mgnify:CR=1 FL=1
MLCFKMEIEAAADAKFKSPILSLLDVSCLSCQPILSKSVNDIDCILPFVVLVIVVLLSSNENVWTVGKIHVIGDIATETMPGKHLCLTLPVMVVADLSIVKISFFYLFVKASVTENRSFLPT